MAEKMRVHILAKELNVPSKAIIEKCRAEGIDTVKNHMSTLTAGLHASIREWFSEASSHDALETAKPVDLKKTRISPRRAKAKTTAPPASAVEESPPVAVAEPSTAAPLVAEVSVPPAPVVAPEPAAPEPPEAASEVPEVVAEAETVEPTPAPEIAEVAEAVEAPSEPDAAPSPEPEIVAEAPAEGEPVAEATPEVAEEEAPDAEHTPEERPKPRKPVKPAGPQHVPAPAKLQGPRVVRYEAPERDLGPIRRRPPAAKREESIDLGDSSPPPPIPAEPGKQGAASGRPPPDKPAPCRPVLCGTRENGWPSGAIKTCKNGKNAWPGRPGGESRAIERPLRRPAEPRRLPPVRRRKPGSKSRFGSRNSVRRPGSTSCRCSRCCATSTT